MKGQRPHLINIPLLLCFFISSLLQSCGQAVNHRNERDKITSLDSLGQLTLYNDAQKALRLFHSARDIAEEINDRTSIANCNSQCGLAYELLGNYDSAFISFKIAKEEFQKEKNENGVNVVNSNFAILFKSAQDYESAIRYTLEALTSDSKEQHQDTEKLIIDHLNLGELYCLNGRLDLARQHNIFAAQLISSNAHNWYYSRLYKINCGNVHFNEANFQYAIDSYKAALNYFPDSSDREAHSEAYLGIARCYLKMNPSFPGYYDTILLYTNKSMRLATEMNDSAGIFRAARMLDSIYSTPALRKADMSLAIVYKTDIIAYQTKMIESLASLNRKIQELNRENEEYEHTQAVMGTCMEITLYAFAISLIILIFSTRTHKLNIKFISEHTRIRIIKIISWLGVLILYEYLILLTDHWLSGKIHDVRVKFIVQIIIGIIIVTIHEGATVNLERYLESKERRQGRDNRALRTYLFLTGTLVCFCAVIWCIFRYSIK